MTTFCKNYNDIAWYGGVDFIFCRQKTLTDTRFCYIMENNNKEIGGEGMKLYIKQHIFTFGDRFSVYNESGEEVFFVEGEVFTFGKKLHLLDRGGRELAFIRQKLMSFLPRYIISRGEREVAEVVKQFTLFRHEYSVEGLGWHVSGDFFDHEYSICSGEREIARVSKEWFTWGDAYAIDIGSGEDAVNVLAVVLIIDAVLDAEDNG